MSCIMSDTTTTSTKAGARWDDVLRYELLESNAFKGRSKQEIQFFSCQTLRFLSLPSNFVPARTLGVAVLWYVGSLALVT